MSTPGSHHIQENERIELLQNALESALNSRVSIRSLDRRRSEYSSWYLTEILTVHLHTGEHLEIFFKDFGSYQHAKDDMEHRRERELQVYKDLLLEANLGTARYYGSVWDAAENRYWLFLEYVPAIPLAHSEFEYWLHAAKWLGKMHGHFAKRSEYLKHCDYLVVHDQDFFSSKAELALNAVSQTFPDLLTPLKKAMTFYAQPMKAMTSQAGTLVHGAYIASQILLDTQSTPLRICPIDWEQAAFGSALYDLAFISDGFTPPRLNRMLDAYRLEAIRNGIDVPENDEMIRLINGFRFHKILNWLSQAFSRSYSEAQVVKLVRMAERLSEILA